MSIERNAVGLLFLSVLQCLVCLFENAFYELRVTVEYTGTRQNAAELRVKFYWKLIMGIPSCCTYVEVCSVS